MVITLHSHHRGFHQRRDDEHGSEFQSGDSDFLPEVGQVVFIGSSDSLDQTMHFETFEYSGNLRTTHPGQEGAKGTVLESPNTKLSADDAFEQLQILAKKEIKPAIGSLAIRSGLRDLLKILDPDGGIFDGGDEFQVTSIRRFHQFPKNGKAVNSFLQRSILHLPGAIPMFHPPVVFEKTDIVDGGLDAQDDSQFVIHLNRHRAHMMFNSRPFNPGMEIIADLSLIGPLELASQEGSDPLRFDTVDRRTGHGFIEWTQIPLAFENHIRSELDLHQGPMISRREMPKDGTVRSCCLIQSPVKKFYLKAIGEVLSFLEVFRFNKRILQKIVGKTFPLEKACQVMVTIKIELQPEGSPGRHPQIAQSQIFQNEVKIVVDAFGLRAPKKRFARLFIVPGFKRGTGLHGREDMDQSRMIPALGDDLLKTFFFTEVLLSDEFNLHPMVPAQLLRPQTDFVPHGFDKLGIIENTNALSSQMATHSIGITDIGKCPGDDHPIKARENPSNLTGISFCQGHHGSPLERFTEGSPMLIEQRNSKVNLNVLRCLRSSIAPVSSAAPLFGRG